MIPRQFNYDLDFRRRQIDTLKIFNDNVQEVKKNEEYLVPFTSGGRAFSLKVIIGKNFPNEKPLVFLNPIIKHSWCNSSTGEIETAPGLLSYTPHSDLGRVVQAIIREFEKYPPPLFGNNKTNDLEPCNLNTASVKVSQDNSMNELSKLSLEELKKLDSDPVFFDDFIEEMSVVQALNEELDSMINQVENISKENLTKEDHLNEMKAKLSHDVNTLKSLGEKCERLNQKYQKKSEEFAPQHIKELLQISVSNAETDCEKHVEQFLDGKMDVQTFLNCYTHSKKISAIRKAKEERLAHQLNALERTAFSER